MSTTYYSLWLTLLLSVCGCGAVCAQALSVASPAMPILRVVTGGQAIVDEPKIDVMLLVIDPANENYTLAAAIEIRGRSSQSFAKQSFALELRDSLNKDLDFPLLGLPADDDWVLHGPYADRTLLRNALSYQTARALGYYAPRSTFCELYVDEDYRGIYLLVEKVQPAPHKVDIDAATTGMLGEDIDYLFEINFEREQPEDGWRSGYSNYEDFDFRVEYQFVRPRAKDLETDQKLYLEEWMNELETDLVTDPKFDIGSKIELQAWIDYVLLNEVARNVDSYTGSTFLVKRAGGKIAPGPVWDHNFAYGNTNYCPGFEGLGFIPNQNCQWKTSGIIFQEVWARPAVQRQVAERYFELRRRELGPGLFGRLDSLARVLRPHQQQNFDRWPIAGQYIWPNEFVGFNWEEDVAFLRDWLDDRLHWLDDTFVALLEPNVDVADSPLVLLGNPSSAASGLRVLLPAFVREPVEVEVRNALGFIVDRQSITYISSPMASGAPPGVYFVRRADGSGATIEAILR